MRRLRQWSICGRASSPTSGLPRHLADAHAFTTTHAHTCRHGADTRRAHTRARTHAPARNGKARLRLADGRRGAWQMPTTHGRWRSWDTSLWRANTWRWPTSTHISPKSQPRAEQHSSWWNEAHMYENTDGTNCHHRVDPHQPRIQDARTSSIMLSWR